MNKSLPIDVEADISAIKELFVEYAAAMAAGDIDRWISLWTADGIQMPPNIPARFGKGQIRAKVQGSFELYDSSLTINTEEVRVTGDWAFARGTYTYTVIPKADEDIEKGTGKFLSILERQVDGSWKLARDSFNLNVPPLLTKKG